MCDYNIVTEIYVMCDEYHIRPFTENESAEEGKAPVVAEGNDDREVENKTLKIDFNVNGYKLNNQFKTWEGSPHEETLSKILSKPGGAPL